MSSRCCLGSRDKGVEIGLGAVCRLATIAFGQLPVFNGDGGLRRWPLRTGTQQRDWDRYKRLSRCHHHARNAILLLRIALPIHRDLSLHEQVFHNVAGDIGEASLSHERADVRLNSDRSRHWDLPPRAGLVGPRVSP